MQPTLKASGCEKSIAVYIQPPEVCLLLECVLESIGILIRNDIFAYQVKEYQ